MKIKNIRITRIEFNILKIRYSGEKKIILKNWNKQLMKHITKGKRNFKPKYTQEIE